MPTIAVNSHETSVDGARPQTEPSVISIPDAERLVLQSRFVRNQLEAEILSDIEARIRRATLLEPSAVPGDLVGDERRVAMIEWCVAIGCTVITTDARRKHGSFG